MKSITKKQYFLLSSIILLTVLALDQGLKIWVLKNMYLGQTKQMLGNWFYLHFTENNGMAFGVELGGITGKLILTAFRLLAVAGIIWYLIKQIRENAHIGLIACISLILAGALGNIIDSVFYGVWFNEYVTYTDKGSYFLGRVVDMLYFPIIETHYPSWFPGWGGQDFTFFRPIFNLADTSISTGVISIIVFQKRFFGNQLEEPLLSDESENDAEDVNSVAEENTVQNEESNSEESDKEI